MIFQRITRQAGRACTAALCALMVCGSALVAAAQDNPFRGNWVLDPDASILTFLTAKDTATKKGVVENSKFVSFNGMIDENGEATIKVQLNSVDTGIDLRNVRMRFLFFETYKFPEATVTARIDANSLAELRSRRRISYKLPFTLDMHGVQNTFEADTVVTLLSDKLVSVASAAPVPIPVALYGMEENVLKLEDAAKVTILPAGAVSFNFVFANGGGGTTVPVLAAVAPEATAVEAKGNFDTEACKGRFEILSRTGAVYFKTGSSAVEGESAPLLQTVADIAKRCPDLNIMIAGHTDSAGDDEANQRLSEARARSVLRYLAGLGLQPDRMRSVGFGETKPVAANDSPRNMRLNRRIEFSVFDG